MNEKPIILVVDDTPANQEILLDALEDDYEVVTADNGLEALKRLASDPLPDLVLLDVMMPVLDGYETCRQMKADQRTASVPVVFVTAQSEEDDEARGLSLGAIDYIIKPFRPGLVRARIRNILALKQYQDHLEEMVALRTRQLEQSQEATMMSLAGLAEYRDPETGNHIHRTKHYVLILTAYLVEQSPADSEWRGLDPALVARSSTLHDVGKVGVPDGILLKPGRLTPEEFEAMKRHTLIGRDAIMAAESRIEDDVYLQVARDIAHLHHEKWDGSGYPEGLAGRSIPAAARVMALADVYDALVSKRVYKPALPHEKAVEIILEGRGAHFDPEVSDAFAALEPRFREIAYRYADHEEERNLLAPM